jgi:predicted ATPase/DNA-binding CsgD family transcriptional regulator
MTSTNLPVQLTSFIGRQRELAAIEQSLSAARLVTLTGVGGCGKTRLAVQLAGKISDHFPDGVYFVDLAPLRESDLVPQIVLEALGLHIASDQPLLEALLNFVRPKGALIVLDNCEHLIAACAQLAQQMLSYAPELHILATSREALAVAGERIYPLSGLAWPAFTQGAVRKGQSRLDFQELMGFDAIRLFVERASAILHDFTLTSDNVPAVVEICQRLDGLPLAIELASARLNVMTVREIADRLDDRFALLTSRQRTGLEARHHTLRAAIDWSYALLTAEERTLLRRLAVFAAGCSLDTARAVCSGEEIGEGRILDLLSSLVDKSLVLAETTGKSQARYRLLETIREYALEKLDEADEAARLRDRHLDLFLVRAEEAAPKLNDAYQQLWLNWLESEHDNLRAALAWALESGQIEAGLRIAIAISRFWEIRGHVQEGMAWFERLLAQADERISLVVHAHALTYTSFMAMFLGDASAATVYGREAVALAEAAGDEGNPVLILALSSLDSGARAAGDYQTAFAIGERTIQLLRESSGPSFYLGMALLAHGDVAMELGHYENARAALEESLALAREAGDAFRIAHAFNSLGDLARYQGNYAEAISAYENSVDLLRKLDAQHDLASVLRNLGRTSLQVGDIERAHAMFSESLAIHQAEQHRVGMAECLIGFASIAVLIGKPVVGVRLLAAATASGRQRTPYAWPTKRMDYEKYLELARSSLTVAEFQAAQSEGSRMSLEQAIDYAQNLALNSGIAPAEDESPGSLTGRERQVAALIGQGKTNGEIAAELFLSKRTVETHVGKILSKLGLTSRTQVMRWAIDHGLTQTPG